MKISQGDFQRMVKIWEHKTTVLTINGQSAVYHYYVKTFDNGNVSFCMKPYRQGAFNG